MPLQIMQNLYPASWLYLTGHCYDRSMFVYYYLLLLFLFITDGKFFAELCKFFQFQIKC